MEFLSTERMDETLRSARRIAVLGIKPESRRDRAGFYIPEFLAGVGYEVIPVPVYYPEVETILGLPVHRSLREVPGDVDVLSVLRKPEDVPQHVPDILALRPRVVWFQSGYVHMEAAEEIYAAGIPVALDCILCRVAMLHRAPHFKAQPRHKHPEQG